jgi:hypothetical protein
MRTKSAILRSIAALMLCHTASAQFFSAEMLNLMNEAQRIAETGNISAITALAGKNPGFVKEITEAALKANPGNRTAIIKAMANDFPRQGEAIALAVVRGAPPNLAAELSMVFTLDFGSASLDRPPSEVIAIAGKLAAVEPKAASVIATAAIKATGAYYAPNVAAVVARAAPQEAANIVTALIVRDSSPLSEYGNSVSVAVAVAKVAPNQTAAIMTAITKITDFSNVWSSNPSLDLNVVFASALMQTVPDQRNSILQIVQNKVGETAYGRPLEQYIVQAGTQSYVQNSLSRAAVAVSQGSAIPSPSAPSSGAAPATPITPVDPSMNVSRSS